MQRSVTLLAVRPVCQLAAQQGLWRALGAPVRQYAQRHTKKKFPPRQKKPKPSKAGITDTPPPVPYPVKLPLPWTGRLGYSVSNTYLASAVPAVYCSRTCRFAAFRENSYPLKDPSKPYDSYFNPLDREQPADERYGRAFVERIAMSNLQDLSMILRWNERFGIRFFRLSPNLFPHGARGGFAYSADFATEELADIGRFAAEHNHRLTMERRPDVWLDTRDFGVTEDAVLQLEHYDEVFRRMLLPEQLNRDAVVVLSLSNDFEEDETLRADEKEETLARFRSVYLQLAPTVQARVVLKNDDVAWSVEELLPFCESLEIPLVLDYFHHSRLRGTTDGSLASVAAASPLAQRVRATWAPRGITPKLHYAELRGADPLRHPQDPRNYSERVVRLPPCPPDADLLVESKDKEQSLFDLMWRYELPGHEAVGDIEPYKRCDSAEMTLDPEAVNMGGPEGHVFWPQGRDKWLRPYKKPTGGMVPIGPYKFK